MKLAFLTYSRGKYKLRNNIENHPTMTLGQLQSRYSGHVATAEEVQREKVEMPGPEWKLMKTDRYYIAFTGE